MAELSGGELGNQTWKWYEEEKEYQKYVKWTKGDHVASSILMLTHAFRVFVATFDDFDHQLFFALRAALQEANPSVNVRMED